MSTPDGAACLGWQTDPPIQMVLGMILSGGVLGDHLSIDRVASEHVSSAPTAAKTPPV
jgi:hypothetical protein